MKVRGIVVIAGLLAVAARGEIVSKPVEYKEGQTTLEGLWVYDDSKQGKRPGVLVITPEGKHLGTIITPRHVHNMAWGDDGKTLYLCARSALYRIQLNVTGVRP